MHYIMQRLCICQNRHRQCLPLDSMQHTKLIWHNQVEELLRQNSKAIHHSNFCLPAAVAYAWETTAARGNSWDPPGTIRNIHHMLKIKSPVYEEAVMASDIQPGIFFHSTPTKIPHLTPLWKYTKHGENKNRVHMQETFWPAFQGGLSFPGGLTPNSPLIFTVIHPIALSEVGATPTSLHPHTPLRPFISPIPPSVHYLVISFPFPFSRLDVWDTL